MAISSPPMLLSSSMLSSNDELAGLFIESHPLMPMRFSKRGSSGTMHVPSNMSCFYKKKYKNSIKT